ncbi:MAG TPA: DNA mismatch repair endonuclease MutL [Terriglobia bacterium]|nr:DNA mismatch repair endonuclease MutL [Terriglobia bacterium]
MSVIHILPEAVANKIAAGEVVERPASIVKELVENSVDAGANFIEVAVESGGKRLIRVVDDGCGMDHDDALLAFERHATSKIRSAEDLFDVSTLGFRGEALPSISSVARLVLETRHDSESSGTRIEIHGGRLRDVKEIAWPAGTRIEVRDLFYNTPARRKFLKSESTELGHIAGLVTHYALAHPEKSFRLASLSNEILNVSPVADFRSRLYQVMGAQLLEQLIEIAPAERAMPIFAPPEAPERNDEEDGPEPVKPVIVRLSGFVSRPDVQKLNRNQIYFFVNRRLVRDRLILHAITEAYRNIVPPKMFPVALIFLELPPAEVDVNVHPSKTEVRFRHSAFIHDFARDSIRQALVAARPVAAFPMGPMAPMPPMRNEVRAAAAEDLEIEATERLGEEAPTMRGAPAPNTSVREQDFHLSPPRPEPRPGILPLTGGAFEPQDFGKPRSFSLHAHSVVAPSVVERGGDILPASIPASEFPANLRPLGQVQESFIVATNAEGLWIIDQHVAHERVLFERHLRQRREKKVEAQRLLLPIIVELTPQQLAAFRDIAEELGANGFDVEPFGQRTVAVKTAPAEIRAEEVERLLVEILDGMGPEARALSLDTLRGKIGASVACHAAIKINMALDRHKMEWLLRELARTECPMSCPHGRPVLLRFGLKDIAKAFKRI